MKWEVVEGRIEAQSRYHDEGVPFRWWITETAFGGVMLRATTELLPHAKTFNSVRSAMEWADTEDSSEANDAAHPRAAKENANA